MTYAHPMPQSATQRDHPQARLTSSDQVIEAMPRHLIETLASLDRARPRVAAVALSRLRPGSAALLGSYGLASFGPRGADGAHEVTLHDGLWDVVRLAKASEVGSPAPVRSTEELLREVDSLPIAGDEGSRPAARSTPEASASGSARSGG